MLSNFLTTAESQPSYMPLVWSSLACLMLTPSLAAQSGATYYVSTKGNDSNPGTISSPWLTIQHAANTVSAGATVYVFGGVYNESVNFSGVRDSDRRRLHFRAIPDRLQ